jgi:hypothetical protein
LKDFGVKITATVGEVVETNEASETKPKLKKK